MFAVESLNVLEFWGADELALQIVGPAVIAAAKEFARAATFGRRSGAMTADVVEAAQRASGAAYEQQRFAVQFGGKEVARQASWAVWPATCQQRLNIFCFSSAKTSGLA